MASVIFILDDPLNLRLAVSMVRDPALGGSHITISLQLLPRLWE